MEMFGHSGNSPPMETVQPAPGCSTCRHHSKVSRHKVFAVDSMEHDLGLDSPDGEAKFADTSDEPDGEREDVYTCQHPKQLGTSPSANIGEDAGRGCPLHEIGRKRGVDSPQLLSALARFDSLRDEPTEEETDRLRAQTRENPDGSLTFIRDVPIAPMQFTNNFSTDEPLRRVVANGIPGYARVPADHPSVVKDDEK